MNQVVHDLEVVNDTVVFDDVSVNWMNTIVVVYIIYYASGETRLKGGVAVDGVNTA